MRHLWLVALVVVVLSVAWTRLHPPQPWDFYPPTLPVGTDELLFPNQI